MEQHRNGTDGIEAMERHRKGRTRGGMEQMERTAARIGWATDGTHGVAT